MNRLLACLLLCVSLLVSSITSPAPARAEASDITAASRSVVRVVLIQVVGRRVALVGHGSGFAVAPNLIVTNAHVVAPLAEDDSLRLGIVPSQGSGGWFARVVRYSPGNDLALLELTEPGNLPPATLYPGAVEDGAPVHAVGYPANVDLAQGLSIGDMVSPTTPVKSQGNVSAGRSARQFDTILHTAAIGAGNSGGPLLDACGRVIGANSFGTIGEASDSEFYFAVSMREIMRFLQQAGVRPQTSSMPCRSIADLDREEEERLAGEKAAADAAAARAGEARREALRQAQLAVFAEREDGMAMAGLFLILALAAAGGSFWIGHRRGERDRRLALGAAAALLLLAAWAWISRPAVDEIDRRAAEAVAGVKEGALAAPSTAAAAGAADAGPTRLLCVLDADRSRVTVSDIADVPFTWTDQGCVNGRTQYGLAADGWSKVLVPNEEDTVTVATYDPQARSYRTERFLLDMATMARVRADKARLASPACGSGEDAARRLGDAQAALRALLPASPNERLVYDCTAATAR